MAVFSDEWNWSFSPKNLRSRRQRFLNSGETISGFTAIFCDDWKDIVDDKEEIDDYIWPSKRGRDEDVDFFVQHWDSSLPQSKRQRLESPAWSLLSPAVSPESPLSPSANSSPESLSFRTTSPEHQFCEFDKFESEKGSSLGDSEWIVTPRSMDGNEQKLLTPGYALSEDLLPRVPTPVDLEIPMIDKVDRDLYLALISDEAESSSAAVTNLDFKTKTSNSILDSCEEASVEQWPYNDGCEVEPGGFEFWNDFIIRYMGV
jgi:hypothetical protein